MADFDSVGFTLREMADQYESTLKLMNGASNKIRAKFQGKDVHSSVIDDALAGNRYYAQLHVAKKVLERDMSDAIKDHPIYEWAMGVPGLNRVTICRIVGLIPMDTPDNFFAFSKLQSFAGYAPGKDRLVKGQKATYSRRLKTALFVATDTVIKSSGIVQGKPHCPEKLYSEHYHNWRVKYAHRHGVGATGRNWLEKQGLLEGVTDYKEYTTEEGKKKKLPVWPDARQHAAARRKALTYLLAHIWRCWRTELGWPMRPMYFQEQLGHTFVEDLHLYSSPALAERKKKQRNPRLPDLDTSFESDNDTDE